MSEEMRQGCGMNQDEPNNHSPNTDRRWNQLYWAHIVVFVGFTALIAWEVHAFSPSFPRQPAAIQSMAATPLPAPAVNQHPEQGTRAKAEGHKIAVTTLQTPAASVPPQERDRWSSGDVVSAMSSFYTTVIALLVALIGIMGVLAGFTLRSLSRASAEDTAHEQAKLAMNHYISSRKFTRDVGIAVEETAITADMERLAEEVSKMRRLLTKRLGISGESGNEEVEGQVEQQAPGPEQL